MREVRLKSGRRIILSDTVGFISDLPTMLVAAFRATLEEVIEADLILHVRDIAHAETDSQARDVEAVLTDLGIDTVSVDGRDPRGVEQDRPAEPGHARGGDERRALAGTAAGSRLGGDGRGDRRLCSPTSTHASGAATSSWSLLFPGTRAASSTGSMRKPRSCRAGALDSGDVQAKVRVASEKKERLLAQARRAGAALTPVGTDQLRHVHIA